MSILMSKIRLKIILKT